MTLKQWNDISKEFTDALILGNGASIALHRGFAYDNLWENAIGHGLISAELQSLAKHLKTGANFELLLRQLWIAEIVDDHFEIDASKIKDAYTELRDGLIQTVRKIHCSHDAVLYNLRNAIPFLRNFETIFSLNYDLLVYWAIMDGNDAQDKHMFKDCFNRGDFAEDWKGYRESYRGEKSTLVFFPHGALQFAQSNSGIEKKLAATNSSENLLEYVLGFWGRTSVFPLFVTGGDSKEKMRSIQRSKYLSTVYDDVLPESGSTLVIYGWSMDENVDGHLLKQIGKGKYTKLAISVYQSTEQGIADYIAETRRKLERFGITNITYFDAQSEGSWPQKQAGT